MEPIEVFADVWCPFAHAGVRRLVDRRTATGSARPIRFRAWPLELVNGQPMDAAFIGEEVEDLRAQVSPGLFTGFRVDRFPVSTLPALALAERAYRVDLSTGEQVSLALRDALFETGLDVGDAEVLAAIGTRFGIGAPDDADAAAVQASYADGIERGVVGSPHFFVDGTGFFCPGLAIRRVDGHLRIQAKVEEFDAFATAALG